MMEEEQSSLLHFSFVLPQKLAGCAALGGWHDLAIGLKELKTKGIVGVVSLTEWSLNDSLMKEHGMDYLHLPIPDFTAPTTEQANQFVAFVDTTISSRGGGVVVHCLAGRGRTGTMLACYLVSKGTPPAEAIAEVREKRPGSIESLTQQEFIETYAESLHNQAVNN